MQLTKKNDMKDSYKVLLNIPVPWVFVIAYLIGVMFQLIFPVRFSSPHTINIIKFSGVVIFFLGAVLAAWSLLIFRKAKTTTTPGQSSRKLIISGPYKFTRNPMYVSLTLAYLGEAGLLAQIWPLLFLPFVLAYINWVVIPLEEKVLENDFGKEYLNYKLKVRKWL